MAKKNGATFVIHQTFIFKQVTEKMGMRARGSCFLRGVFWSNLKQLHSNLRTLSTMIINVQLVRLILSISGVNFVQFRFTVHAATQVVEEAQKIDRKKEANIYYFHLF